MHDLLKLSYMKNLPNEVLNVYHLSIDYDEATEILIYNRKLLSGSGLPTYGLMVAKSLGLPKDFIDQANEIILEITGKNKNIIEMKTSRYNTEIYVDNCAMCGKTRAQTELHSHHIQEQSKADDRKLIGNIPMNAKDNIIILWHGCHTSLHSKNQELETVAISNGKLVRLKTNTSIISDGGNFDKGIIPYTFTT